MLLGALDHGRFDHERELVRVFADGLLGEG